MVWKKERGRVELTTKGQGAVVAREGDDFSSPYSVPLGKVGQHS